MIENHTDRLFTLPKDLFLDYESYRIRNRASGKLVETFWNASIDPVENFFELDPYDVYQFTIHYEAFECFQGTRQTDGSVDYKPFGDLQIFHHLFETSALDFQLSEEGVSTSNLDMKRQDG